MIQTLTFNDFTDSKDKKAFILKAITEYQRSEMYLKAQAAQLYYSTDNASIAKRMGYLQRQMRKNINVKFNRLRNAFFPKAVKKLVMYTIGNGATLDDAQKLKIDRRFDKKLIIAAINACVDGVVWGFPHVGNLSFFRATEFVPLVDERTSKLMAGIRFWQVDPKKPVYIELYEIEGITEYISKDGGAPTEEKEQRPYKQTVRTDVFETTVINGENYDVLPVFPLYANELKTSELTTGLHALIDAYDAVSSDLVDSVVFTEGLYSILKNYGGADLREALDQILEVRALPVDGGDAGTDIKTIEAPFNAKQYTLDLIEKRMYADWLLPDSDDVRAVTATEIKAAREDMDIKADILEWQVADFVENVLKLNGIEELLPDFKRRTTTNDSETVQNIAVSMGTEPWRTYADAIMDDPTIPQDEKEDRIAAMDLAKTGVPPNDEGPPPSDDSPRDEV